MRADDPPHMASASQKRAIQPDPPPNLGLEGASKQRRLEPRSAIGVAVSIILALASTKDRYS